jgi:hypothetical protein
MRHDPKGCELTLAKVRAALDAIRVLEGRIDSDLVRREIDARADELETAVGRFRPADTLLRQPLMNTVTGIGEIRATVADALNAVNRLLN